MYYYAFTAVGNMPKIVSMYETSDYDYELPGDLIAQQPLSNRIDARLLVVDRSKNQIDHLHVRDLPKLLTERDCLVLNDTRVVPARLVGVRTQTSGRWHGLFLEADDSGNWLVMSKTRGKLRATETITLQDRAHNEDVQLRLLTKLDDGTWVVRPESDENTFHVLDRVGRVPLPHYIRGGEMVDADLKNYQTVFAKRPGAVAAPTAGLHFTDQLLKQLEDIGVSTVRLTLHVGLGTFRPINSERVDEYKMHEEWGCIDEDAVGRIQQCKQDGGRVVAVGTTVTRVLETAAADGTLTPWRGKTNLFICPPYECRTVDVMMTNFHLPKTTLLVLARTFGGDDLIQRAYAEAIAEKYRFFSYGDAMLIV